LGLEIIFLKNGFLFVLFFCLDTKEPKSQDRNNIQHISVIGRDVAFVVLILLPLNLDEMVPVVIFFL
jgi:hypothetical protein